MTVDSIFAIIQANPQENAMFKIIFYEGTDGTSELWEFLEALRRKAEREKDARIQFRQISMYIQLLQEQGNLLPANIAKHLEDGIYELRPGNNRIFFFFNQDENFVLLHHFRKKSKKTPRREIEKAKRERKDFIQRQGKNNENMG